MTNKKILLMENRITEAKMEKFGLQILGSVKHDNYQIEHLSSGSYSLDQSLNIGGWPCGKIIEIYGNDSSGKSTLALQTVSAAQKNNKICVYIDLENTLNPEWAHKIGVDMKKLYLCSPENGEQTFTLINDLVKDNTVDLIIVDSVTSMVPNAEYCNQIEDQTMGLHARLMSKGLRILQRNLIGSKTTVIFINQLREKIGGNSFMPSMVTTGGRALRYASSVRVEVKRIESIKNIEKIIGFVTKAVVVKNKYGSPMSQANMGLYFDSGFNQYHEIISLSIANKTIVKSGSWYSYEGKNIGQGLNATIDFFKKDEEKFLELKEKLKTTHTKTQSS